LALVFTPYRFKHYLPDKEIASDREILADSMAIPVTTLIARKDIRIFVTYPMDLTLSRA